MLSILSTLFSGTVNVLTKSESGQPEEQVEDVSAWMMTTRLNCKLFCAFARQQLISNTIMVTVFFMSFYVRKLIMACCLHQRCKIYLLLAV
mgnify:CR=1 FL=1